MADEPKTLKSSRVGGMFFFASLVSVVVLAVASLALLPFILSGAPVKELAIFASAALLGACTANVLIRNHLSVFLHELKHSIVSNLAGNRAKKMVVKKRSGHFIYEYTEDTKHLNAIIALAPYIFPLFSLGAIVAALTLFRDNPPLSCGLIATAFGADLLLNWRDVSPIQTDITGIRGGYLVGLSYIIAMNVVAFSIAITLAVLGPRGVLVLGVGIMDLLQQTLLYAAR